MKKKKTSPRKYDLYDIFCAVLYVLKGGIQWRMMPADFPSWKLVYYYFTVWTKINETGNTILDSKSIKNADTANSKGYDSSQKVSGIKLHLAVDILGLPLAMHVTTADKSDKSGAREMLACNFCIKIFTAGIFLCFLFLSIEIFLFLC